VFDKYYSIVIVPRHIGMASIRRLRIVQTLFFVLRKSDQPWELWIFRCGSPHPYIKHQFCRSGKGAGHDAGRKLKSTSVRWTLVYSALNATPLIGSNVCRETLNTHRCINQQPRFRYVTWNKMEHGEKLSQATMLLSSLNIILRSDI
jgi:hypothetical protein